MTPWMLEGKGGGRLPGPGVVEVRRGTQLISTSTDPVILLYLVFLPATFSKTALTVLNEFLNNVLLFLKILDGPGWK